MLAHRVDAPTVLLHWIADPFQSAYGIAQSDEMHCVKGAEKR